MERNRENHSIDTTKSNSQRSRPHHDRRGILKALGLGAGIVSLSDTAAGASDMHPSDGTGSAGRSRGGRNRRARGPIDPYYGYSTPGDEPLPGNLRADHTVSLEIGEPPFQFHFDPIGLHVDVGDVVRFEIASPDHTITAYHVAHGRQQRVPDGAKPFSSPVITPGGAWFYEFEHAGTYDLYCAPHQVFGMVMRLVVGDPADDDYDDEFGSKGRPPVSKEELLAIPGVEDWPFPTSAAILEAAPLAADNVVENGPITVQDLAEAP